jgi:serine phosphatase RsbU (regulator of sigma subunit)
MANRAVVSPHTKDLSPIPFELQVFCEPVFGVGGDFYDTFALDAHRYALCIGDVCGKGTEASLLVAFCQMYLRQYAPHSPGPAHTICQVAQALRPHIPPEVFITLFYAVLDTQARTLSFSRAGHEPALLLSPASAPQPPSVLTLVGEGMALGLGTQHALEASLETCQTNWQPGQALILYTDGLTERGNAAGQPYGLEGLISALGNAKLGPAGACAKTLQQHILDHWQLYSQGEPLHDDVTLLTLSLG